mmetsp:Transcript_39214/g.77629  ORF Transcript_39214/g.77629 Transcript_39214/m.77629 type:complete len:88 (+) Transcript_39214:43-306(+)
MVRAAAAVPDEGPRKAGIASPRSVGSRSSSRSRTFQVDKGNNKFLIGLIGATLMAVQAFAVVTLLTSWLRKENKEMLDALAAAGLKS